MLIGTRLGLQIQDPAWYEHRLAVFSAITAPSMLAQDDQEFEWALFVDPEMPAEARSAFEEALDPFEGRAFLHAQHGLIRDSLPGLVEVRGLVDHSGYMLTGRIDDDDAWHRTTVGDVRRRAARRLDRGDGSRGFCMTYDDGLVWLMYDMVDVDHLRRKGATVTHEASVRPYTSQFTSMSGFVCSPAVDRMTSYASKHSGVPDVLESKGFTVEVVSTSEPMWLYTRHKQATGSPDKGSRAAAREMSVAALSDMFGIDVARTERYSAEAHNYGYRRFNPLKRRGAYRTLLLKIEQEIGAARAGGRPTAQLEHQKERLLGKLTREAEEIVEKASQSESTSSRQG